MLVKPIVLVGFLRFSNLNLYVICSRVFEVLNFILYLEQVLFLFKDKEKINESKQDDLFVVVPT